MAQTPQDQPNRFYFSIDWWAVFIALAFAEFRAPP